MGLIIEDGKGTGSKAQVDSNNKMHTFSTSRSEAADVNFATGFSFISFMSPTTLSTNESLVYYIINNDTEKSFVIDTFSFGWNGGSTNFNRTYQLRYYLNPTAPSANNNVTPPKSLNTIYAATKANVVVNIWNGTGNGMTVSSLGTLFAANIHGVGRTAVSFGSTALVITPGNSFGITAQGIEQGTLSFNVYGYTLVNA